MTDYSTPCLHSRHTHLHLLSGIKPATCIADTIRDIKKMNTGFFLTAFCVDYDEKYVFQDTEDTV
jgi:hypothetical protein